MKRIRRFLQSEDGVMVDVQAIFLYPLTIFIIFWIIFMGMYMFQGVALQNYAQKLAVISSREVSYPGYIDMPGSGNYVSVFGTHAIDWDTNGENLTITIPKVTDGNVKSLRPYRYLTSIGSNSNILGDGQEAKLKAIAEKIISQNSLLTCENAEVQINVSNYFVSQQVEVTVSETLPSPGLISWLSNKSRISATAFASANDQDEFIRNTDLVFDFAETLAKKLNLDKDSNFGKAIEKVRSFMNKVNGV